MFKNRILIYSLILIVLVGTFFRLYRLYEYATFLGDQGRDAIVVHRIVNADHFPAIGAPASVNTPQGYVYLGPFYYYFLAPFRALSEDPVILAAAVALCNSASIVAVYFMTAGVFGVSTALFTALLIAFSQVNVTLSRFSWNPNILPFISFASFYFFLRCIKSKDVRNYIAFGAITGIGLQLHYLYLAVVTAYIVCGVYLFIKYRFPLKRLRYIAISAASFCFVSIPLFIFDFRHQFMNSKAFFSLFFGQTESISIQNNEGYLRNLGETIQALCSYVLRLQMDGLLAAIVVFTLATGITIAIKQDKKSLIGLITAVIVISLLVIGAYRGDKHEHYFTPLYYIFFLLVAAVLDKVQHYAGTFSKWMVYSFLTIYIINNIVYMDIVAKSPGNQITRARDVAEIIARNVRKQKYTLTTLPDKYSDSTYRYFLIISGKTPIEKDSLEKADELFVVCESACKPIGDPQWDIAYFAPKKIDGSWKHKDVTIYRLIH